MSIDAFLGLSPDPLLAMLKTDYERRLRDCLTFAHRAAEKAAKKIAAKHQGHSTLQEGDRDLVKNVALRGKLKIADHWADIIHY